MSLELDPVDGDVADFSGVPDGAYLCRIAEVRPGVMRSGDERWSFRLDVAEGPHAGKLAAWDFVAFSVRGRARARTVLVALGFPRGDVKPADLLGRTVVATIRNVTYTAPDGGQVRRGEVPYDGYAKAPCRCGTCPACIAHGVAPQGGAS